MTNVEYFTYRESTSPGEFVIVPKDYATFPFNTKAGGSYNLAPARVLGLSYPDYLRFLMTMFPNDVVVRGKRMIYATAYWKRDKMLHAFVKLLNNKLTLAMMKMEEENAAVSVDNSEAM